MEEKIIYNLDGQDYDVIISYKGIKNINFRFEKGVFKVSCPWITPKRMIISGLDKFAKKLLDRSTTTQAFGNDYVYLFGHKIQVTFPGSIKYNDETRISFETPEDLIKKIRKYFLKYMQNRTLYYANLMHCPSYTVKVRQMKSRYGTNSRYTNTITYSLILIHYSPEIIDSVIIHELAHCYVYGHSDNFYRVVYRYCPRYDELRKKLIKAEFA